MFGQRLLSGIVLLAIAIITVAYGGSVLLAVVTIISLIGLFEFYRASNIEKTVLAGIGYAASICFSILLFFQKQEYTLEFILVFFMVLMTCYVLTYPKYVIEKVTTSFFGFFYITVMFSFIYQVRSLEDGFLIVWLIFIGAWGSDTCAYVVGVLIGKHKLPSKLSPKKSIEGCVGGIVGAALIGMVYSVFVGDKFVGISNPLVAFAVIGGVSSILAQVGDLAASAIKRNHNIKDYGTLIPGHGGILDRFDSIIYTAPVVFLLARIWS